MVKPISATLEITSRCNLECKYCFAESSIQKDALELKFDVIKSIIDSMFDLGVRNFLIMGGEPTIHCSFLKIMQYLKSRGISPGFSTNGLFLTESFCNKLAELGIHHNIYVSIDGPNAYIYKSIRGKDCFEKVLQGVNNLRSNGIQFAVSSVIVQQNYFYLDDIYLFAKEFGASFLNLIRFNVEGRGIIFKNEMGIKAKEFNDVCKRLILRYDGFMGFWNENCILPIDESLKFQMKFPKEEDLRQYITIRANGDVLLGRASGGIKIGNCVEKNLYDIWNSAKTKHYTNEMDSVVFNNMILNSIKTQNIDLS